jgi:hypothetical protein
MPTLARSKPQAIALRRSDEQNTQAPRDPNQLAKLIAEIATGKAEDALDTRDQAGVALGKKGGSAQAASITP